MTIQLTDGLGRGNVQAVNKHHKGSVLAETNLTAHFVSVRDGLAFNWISEDDDAAAGDFIFYLQNDDTDRDLFVGSGKTQASGYTARGDGAITGLTAKGSMIATVRVPAGDSRDIPFDDVLILPVGTAIAMEYDTGTTGDAEVLLRGFFLDPENEV